MSFEAAEALSQAARLPLAAQIGQFGENIVAKV